MHTKYPVIPKPVSIESNEGFFTLTPTTFIAADEGNQGNAVILQGLLNKPTSSDLTIKNDGFAGTQSINLQFDLSTNELGDEGYKLEITTEKIIITSTSSRGIFHGIQTLRQLCSHEIEKREPVTGIKWLIPCCTIIDFPRFSWRGFMLDEGRHFFGVEYIKKTLNLLALLKLNKFHWHLTEDQGWRVEIKQFPKLIQVGSRRNGTAKSWWNMLIGNHDNVPHEGYYLQEDIREIVTYALKQNITVIPEIDMPGHAQAALASYPELGCTGEHLEVSTRFGIHSDVLCPGKETTFHFLKAVLDEIMDLFPSRFIHIGGDEVPKTKWRKCPDCQRRMKNESLVNEHQLQHYFFDRIRKFIEARGRRVVGWNQILNPELSQDALLQYWLGNRKVLYRAIQNGNEVINSAYLETYLDHSYLLTPLKKAYGFDPIFKLLDEKYHSEIIGLEAPLWTEWVQNSARFDYQAFPRLAAYAETGWSQKSRKEFDEFLQRLNIFVKRLDILGVKYAPEKDWDPPWYKRIFGILSIIYPQRNTSNS